MAPPRKPATICSLLLVLYTTTSTASQFSSHVTVNTPARSFSHGVGDPIPISGRRGFDLSSAGKKQPRTISYNQGASRGYPRIKPSIPFDFEEARGNSFKVSPWLQNNFMEIDIPVLPPSPYKVDSPDPESLWPEGLFLPPTRPFHFGAVNRRGDGNSFSRHKDSTDPFLLEGSEAIAAVQRSNGHGNLFFHDIPHIESLLTNQELRIKNNLKPHRLGSIRYTWPYNRP